MNTNTQKFMVIFMLAFAVIWASASPARASDERDKKTTITTNVPIEVPGRVLPAGTYVFKIVDVAGVRNIVRVYSADEKKIFTTVIGIPDFTLKPPEKADISFYESDPSLPRPMHAWFYPGSQFGIEFAYPENRAVAIARRSEEHVIAFNAPAELPAEPTVKELIEENLIAVEPGGAEVSVAEVHPAQTASVQPAESPSIPRTATPFPLLAVIGLFAAAVAGGLRFTYRT